MKFARVSLFHLFGILLLTGALSLTLAASSEGSVHDYKVVKNIEWVKVINKSLTMDIYTPATGKAAYPVLVIYHGGGWLINTNAIMDSMAVYMSRHAEIVVCNVNFRLLGDLGNTVTMNQIIEDALGAIAWIKEHIGAYQGDAARIIVTGDSSGGHMAAMVLLASDLLESDGFAGASLGYCPTYMPPGQTAEGLAASHALAVQGAILSYGAFDIYAAAKSGMETSANIFWALAGKPARKIFGPSYSFLQNPEMYKAVSPIYIIPQATQRVLPPQLCLVGSKDTTTPPASVKAYVDATTAAGQPIEYWVYADKPHAFLDSTPNSFLGTQFTRDAPPALEQMITWLGANHFTAAKQRCEGVEPEFRLEPNYPNPFNASTRITYHLAHSGYCSIVIFDALGREVAHPVEGLQQAGRHAIRFEAGGLPSGVYFYRIMAGSRSVQTAKMLLVR